MYEILPIAAGAILALAVARWPRIDVRAALAVAVFAGVAVSFASGEWQEGVIFPIWDAAQAAAALVVVNVTVGRRLSRGLRDVDA